MLAIQHEDNVKITMKIISIKTEYPPWNGQRGQGKCGVGAVGGFNLVY